MRESIGDGEVLKDAFDPGQGGVREIYLEWSLKDYNANTYHFLSTLKSRALAELPVQLHEGVNGMLGDRQVLGKDEGYATPDYGHNKMLFLASEAYGNIIQRRVAGPERPAGMPLEERWSLIVPLQLAR
jgi:hypothetical protein